MTAIACYNASRETVWCYKRDKPECHMSRPVPVGGGRVERNSRLSGFYKLSPGERARVIAAFAGLDAEDAELLRVTLPG